MQLGYSYKLSSGKLWILSNEGEANFLMATKDAFDPGIR